MDKNIKILIVDDHPVFRKGLCMIIQNEKDLNLIGEAENGKAALELIVLNQPDIVILDLDMPIMDGIETARELKQKFPKIKSVILTMHKDQELLNMMKPLNIKGYILKDSAIIEIVECINKVIKDKTYISPALTDLILEKFSENESNNDLSNLISKLTPSEKKILTLIAESKTNREISQELFISIRTVENHRFNICNKLNIKGNHSLIKFALTNKTFISSFNK